MSDPIFRFNTVLVLVSALLTAGVVLRLLQGRLWLRYRFFFSFLCFSLFRLAVVSLVPLSRKSYALFFVATEAITALLYVLVTLEIYTLLFERYEGIQWLSRRVTMGALGVSLVIAAISLQPDIASKSRNLALDYLFIAERGILSGLAGLILLMSLFLAWFPVTLPRNVVTHTILFAVYFLAKAFVVLARNLMAVQNTQSLSHVVSVVGSVCLLLWIIRLRPADEAVLQVVGHQWNRADEEKLIRQLELVNAALARSSRE